MNFLKKWWFLIALVVLFWIVVSMANTAFKKAAAVGLAVTSAVFAAMALVAQAPLDVVAVAIGVALYLVGGVTGVLSSKWFNPFGLFPSSNPTGYAGSGSPDDFNNPAP